MDLQSSDSQNANMATDMDIDSYEEKSISSNQSLESADQIVPNQPETSEKLSSEHTTDSLDKSLQSSLVDMTPSPSVLQDSDNGIIEIFNSASTSTEDNQYIDVPSSEELPSVMDYDAIGEFSFESDHMALKGNSDYKKMLQVIIILEAKRAQAIKDLDRLIETREIAMADPIHFVESLERKEELGLPGPQTLPTLPMIDWSKYAITESSVPCAKRKNSRPSSRTIADIKPRTLEILNKARRQSITTNFWGSEEDVFDTFNPPWTAEDQKKLEEFLIQYPHVDTELHRWEKIANAFGNRTPSQVACMSRMYFDRLLRAGKPLPGQPPNNSRRNKVKRQVVKKEPKTEPNAFLPSQTPPGQTLDNDDKKCGSGFDHSYTEGIDENSSDTRIDISDEEEIRPELKETPEYMEYMMLKRAIRDKASAAGLPHHVGYQCNRCGSNPIIGIRWHCTDCELPKSVDFCEDCVDCLQKSGTHNTNHHLEPIHQVSTTCLDKDYKNFLGSDYNYMPSV